MRFASVLCCLTFVAISTAAARADFITIPTKTLTAGSPIVITQASVFVDNNNANTFRACVSFKNIAPKPASLVTFTFRFDDLLGQPLREAILQRTGSFGTGIAIEGKMSALGGNSDSFANCTNLAITNVQPSLETIDVTEVRFEDGSVWKKGQPIPGTQPTAAPGGSGGNSSVNVNGAIGSGGSITTGGGTFGTIAWIPGVRKMIASSLDAESQTDADYGALSKCNQLNGGGTSCKVVVRMFGPQNKCGAVALDEANGKFASSRGPNSNDTIKAALDALQKAGGTLAADSIATIVCNTK